MKKIVVSASLVALSAASLHAMYAPELTRMETAKPWTVSASLRGFYDDNWATTPNNVPSSTKRDSWGFEVRPYVALNFPMEQTYFGLSYLNSSRFYEARSDTNLDPWDFTHEVALKFDHTFSPRTKLSVRDTLLYSQEPDVNTASGLISNPTRSDGSFWRNTASASLFEQATERVGGSLTYNNTIYNYLDQNTGTTPTALSYSARLDRMEQTVPLDVRWQVNPDVVALVGYTFGVANYTGDGIIAYQTVGGIPNYAKPYYSDSRDSMTHTMYLGGSYDVNAQLTASLRVGAQYNDYINLDGANQWTPYLDAMVTYTYLLGSHADFGIKHTMTPTDIAAADATSPTADMEATAFYLMVNHQITAKLTGNFLVQYQYGTYHRGLYDGQHEGMLMLGLYADYRLNPFLSLEAGYNYDLLSSDLRDPTTGLDVRSYDRNRVFLGIRAHY